MIDNELNGYLSESSTELYFAPPAISNIAAGPMTHYAPTTQTVAPQAPPPPPRPRTTAKSPSKIIIPDILPGPPPADAIDASNGEYPANSQPGITVTPPPGYEQPSPTQRSGGSGMTTMVMGAGVLLLLYMLMSGDEKSGGMSEYELPPE